MPSYESGSTTEKKGRARPKVSDRQRYLKRWSALKSSRGTWEAHWRDITDHTSPRRYRRELTDVNRGTKKNDKMLDPIGLISQRTLASGMMAGITSPSRPWMRLGVPVPQLAELESVKAWAWEVTERMLAQLRRTNFYVATASSVYVDLSGPATHLSIVLRDKETCLRFYPRQLGSYWLASSSKGKIDTVYEDLQLTVAQVIEEFGEDQVSYRVRNLWETDKLDVLVTILHAVEPNPDYDPEKADRRGMRWRSCWMECENAEDRNVGFLRESGHRRFPALVPRWAVDGQDVYGSRSPGMDSLPTLKSLQKLEYRHALLTALAAEPPVTAPASMKESGEEVHLVPRGVTYVADSPGPGRVEVKAAIDLQANAHALERVEAAIEKRQRSIREFFLVDFWLAMLNDDRATPATAEEVRAKKEERMLQLGPVLEQIQTEYLEPLIDLLFEAMMEDGLLPPPPREVVEWMQERGLEVLAFDVEYVSIAAAAQKALGITNVKAFLEIVGLAAGADAQAVDNVDVDVLVDEAARVLGINPKIVRAMPVVDQLRAARSRQQQAAEVGDAAVKAAGAAKNLGTTPAPSADNALGALGPALQALGPGGSTLLPYPTNVAP